MLASVDHVERGNWQHKLDEGGIDRIRIEKKREGDERGGDKLDRRLIWIWYITIKNMTESAKDKHIFKFIQGEDKPLPSSHS